VRRLVSALLASPRASRQGVYTRRSPPSPITFCPSSLEKAPCCVSGRTPSTTSEGRQRGVPSGVVTKGFLLLAQYNGRAVPLDEVCRDYFSHPTPQKLIREGDSGDLEIPMVRIENSEKSAKGAHIQHLAAYIDERKEIAQKEYRKIHRR
jgi:hypothetical protein